MTVLIVVRTGTLPNRLRKVTNLSINFDTLGRLSEVTVFASRKFVASGTFPVKFLRPRTPDARMCLQKILIRKNKSVVTKLREIIRKTVFRTFVLPNVFNLTKMTFTRETEEQVSITPKLARINVRNVLHSKPMILSIVSYIVTSRNRLGNTFTLKWTKLKVLTPKSILVRSTMTDGGVRMRISIT